jgi:hypothetical protein
LLEGVELLPPAHHAVAHSSELLRTGACIRVVGTQQPLVQREQTLGEGGELLEGGEQFGAVVWLL